MNIFHYPLTTYPSYFSASSDPLYKVIARTPCLTFAELGGGSPIPRTHQWLTRVGVGGGSLTRQTACQEVVAWGRGAPWSGILQISKIFAHKQFKVKSFQENFKTRSFSHFVKILQKILRQFQYVGKFSDRANRFEQNNVLRKFLGKIEKLQKLYCVGGQGEGQRRKICQKNIFLAFLATYLENYKSDHN